MQQQMEGQEQEQEEPRRLKIKPKVYIIGFFALIYLVRNLYTYFTTERPVSADPPKPYYNITELQQNQQNIFLRTRDQILLIVGLLVVFLVLRYFNETAQIQKQRHQAAQASLNEEGQEQQEKPKKKKKKKT